ncbi:type II secretion system F family protein, partial [Bacteriovoracales bacterium]|nr:type II secretion system F family protein [Bacteriovoracales bacterium]
IFTKQLAIMVNAGIPIMEALEILFKSEKNPALKKSIREISSEVGHGKTIASAMEQQTGFDKLYCSLVKAGETAGVLDVILEKLSSHLENQEKIKKKIKSALTYPIAVMIIGTLVVWGLLSFVVPQFVEQLESTGQEAPFITRFVMDISDFLGEWSGKIFLGIGITFVVLKGYVQTSKTGKVLFDQITMKIPIFGSLIIKGNLGGFSRTLGTMIGSGVAIIEALDICVDTIDNKIIAMDLSKVKKDVIAGKTLNNSIDKIDYFPDMASQMIKVGEQTGRLDFMMDKIANVFEDEIDSLIEGGTKLIEPLIIVVLGGVTATILVAMYLPIFMQAGG